MQKAATKNASIQSIFVKRSSVIVILIIFSSCTSYPRLVKKHDHSVSKVGSLVRVGDDYRITLADGNAFTLKVTAVRDNALFGDARPIKKGAPLAFDDSQGIPITTIIDIREIKKSPYLNAGIFAGSVGLTCHLVNRAINSAFALSPSEQ